MIVLLNLLLISFVWNYNNGVGKTPAMGWNSWNQFDKYVNETVILNAAKGIKKYGLDKVGFKYVNIDDGWNLMQRDKEGRQQPNPESFPNGIKYLADEVHKMGLKLGIYTDLGPYLCEHLGAGSWGHFEIDAQTYADWEVDYVKIDWCYATQEAKDDPAKYYGQFSKAMNETGRHILFSICNWGDYDPWKWSGAIANMWRVSHDIKSMWYKVIDNVEVNQNLYPYAAPYQYNDPDMLEVGVSRGGEKLSDIENKAHFSLWCIMASPLLLGNDLENIPSAVLDVITNAEVISVNQDEMGVQGRIMKETKQYIDYKERCHRNSTEETCLWTQIWKKEMSYNRVAVLLFNHGSKYGGASDPEFRITETIKVLWSDLGIDPTKKYNIRDLWEHKDLGNYTQTFTSNPVKQHDVMMILMTPV